MYCIPVQYIFWGEIVKSFVILSASEADNNILYGEHRVNKRLFFKDDSAVNKYYQPSILKSCES